MLKEFKWRSVRGDACLHRSLTGIDDTQSRRCSQPLLRRGKHNVNAPFLLVNFFARDGANAIEGHLCHISAIVEGSRRYIITRVFGDTRFTVSQRAFASESTPGHFMLVDYFLFISVLTSRRIHVSDRYELVRFSL